MKRRLFLLCSTLLLTGCSSANLTAPAEQSSAAPARLPEESEVIYDGLTLSGRKDYTFLAFHAEEGWLTADAQWVRVFNFEPETDFPEGSFAEITADVTFMDGGEAGYCNEPQIDVLKKAEPVGFEEAIARCGLPDGTADKEWTAVRKIETASGVYLILNDEIVYLNGQKVGNYAEWSDGRHGALYPLYAQPALLDYLTPDSLPLRDDGLEVFFGGEQDPSFTPARLQGGMLYLNEAAEDIIADNVQPMTAEQIRKCREEGIFVFMMQEKGDAVYIYDEPQYYHWVSICSGTPDGDLTMCFDGERTLLLKHALLSKLLHLDPS